MKLICKKNGKILKVGSTVNFDGDKCTIYKIDGTNIGLMNRFDISWDHIEPEYLGAVWDESDFVNHFFINRQLLNELRLAA